jgi:hypothetical protein
MNCPQALKWFGVIAAIATVYGLISMYPDIQRYIKLERM